ncbi:hypothetical protein [Burkholderia gladioli]|uniref:hypothetical protein n=1 Tax=Burkholderia gladioli TaxID=28095 RepID=UPI001FC7C542|nr:hypothetical protein [Burkholderia gladioli]
MTYQLLHRLNIAPLPDEVAGKRAAARRGRSIAYSAVLSEDSGLLFATIAHNSNRSPSRR